VKFVKFVKFIKFIKLKEPRDQDFPTLQTFYLMNFITYIADGGAGSSGLPAFLKGRLTIPHPISERIARPIR
jgi:hypothetical protein